MLQFREFIRNLNQRHLFISEFLWLCRVAALKSLPVHPFNALIFPIFRDCLQSVCIFLSLWFFLFYVLVFNSFVLLAPYVCYHIFSSVKVTDWPPIGKIAAHSAYEMFSWYRYLIVCLFFSHLGFLEWESFAVCAFS